MTLRTTYIVLLLSAFISQNAQGAVACHDIFEPLNAFNASADIDSQNLAIEFLGQTSPNVNMSYGSNAKILHSFEKEGLYYEEIAAWFPSLQPTAHAKLKASFAKELTAPVRQRPLTSWLKQVRPLNFPDAATKKNWSKLAPQQRLDVLTSYSDMFAVLSVKDRALMFENSILTFDDVQAGPDAPPEVMVGDDLGSYEVRLVQAESDRTRFRLIRTKTEAYLDGKVGHQHKFHGWPTDAKVRRDIAPRYIELLDSTTMYLFWRQMKRNPEDVSSILTHPYLGIYTRSSLERLNRAVINGDGKRFNNKFRMVGARSFKARTPEQDPGGGWIPDWELRSGNKGVARDFLEAMVESRFVSGDYSGLREFSSYQFDPSATARTLLTGLVSEEDIKAVEKFQEIHPAMDWSPSKLSHNHVRNRVMSPLLPWQNRLPLAYKSVLLKQEQAKYAKALVAVAKRYEKDVASGTLAPMELHERREYAVSALEAAIFAFSKKVRLDLDFEKYLKPSPTVLPNIQVPVTGPLNVNKIDLGMEYSLRFSLEMTPKTKADAEATIEGFANQVANSLGDGKIERIAQESHGHGISVRYNLLDKQSRKWRVEWDGIQRNYVNGIVKNAHGGHVEIASPKFSPEKIEDDVAPLYRTGRQFGLVPRRSAGGAHVNFDLSQFEAMPVEKGTRAILNMLSYYESNQEIVSFMWQHPRRMHAAQPVTLQPGFAEAVANFRGDWLDLGRMLYNFRYFNTNIGRKPKYVGFNVTAIMTPIVPDPYIEASLDIKNPTQEWFPNFAKVKGRAEVRLFDAPENEYVAALQIKYWRAFMNRTANAPTAIPLAKRFSAADMTRWTSEPALWFETANAHLKDLGLDPEEFKPLLWDSYLNRKFTPIRPKASRTFTDFLPAK